MASTVTATVTGLPAGASTTMTIKPAKGFQVEVNGLSGRCTLVSTGTVTCQLDAGSPSASMTYLHPGQSLVVTFSIPASYRTGQGPVRDPDTSNNSCTWDPRTGSCT